MVLAPHSLCLPIFGFFENLAKGKLFASNTKSDYGLGRYFWIPNAINMISFYIQGFYRDGLNMRVPYMTKFNDLYQVHMEGSRVVDNVNIHDIKITCIPVELQVFWEAMLDRYLCLNGGGGTE